jgi:hypothetical protein
MDLVTHISGVAPTTSFSPGASTPAPFNVPHTGLVDGLGPGSASKNMAELYNRDLLWRRAMIAVAGLSFDPTNWVQEVAAIQAIAAAAAAAVVPPQPGLGYGQTPQSLTGSRALSTTYLNLTGKPIMVHTTVLATSNGPFFMRLTMPDSAAVDVWGPTTLAGGIGNLTVLLPPGCAYLLDPGSTAGSLNRWVEYR